MPILLNGNALVVPARHIPEEHGDKVGPCQDKGLKWRFEVAQGTVKWFSEQKGFGFIVPDEGDKDLFIHRSNVDTPDRTLRDEQRVEFEVGDGSKGPEATQARPI